MTAEMSFGEANGLTFRSLPLSTPLGLALKGTLSHATRQLLAVVFEHRGYIAGGFGTVLGRHYVLDEHKDDDEGLFRTVREHLKDPKAPGTQPAGVDLWRANAGCGDIDVWFPDEAALRAFNDDARRQQLVTDGSMSSEETVTGTAIEHIVPGDAKVQVITRFLLPIEEQLSRFDIYNGMVAVTADTIVFPEHWASLESQRVLHVSTWKPPWTVNRFFKWLHRKGYQHITPATADSVVAAALETLEWYKDHGTDMSKADMEMAISKNALLKHIVQQPDKVQDFIRPIMGALTAERLMEVSAFFRPNQKGYDRAMQEIRKRMEC